MFANKKVLVLGASGGIGKEIVSCFKNYNAEIFYPSHAELDLVNTESIDKYFSEKKIEYDVVVYSAGINNPDAFETLTTENLQRTLSVNTLGFVSVCRHVLPGMKKRGGGHIAVISSIYGIISRKRRLPYALSKHALTGVVQTLALEFAQYNIMVNAISPGFIETEMTSRNNSPEKIKKLVADIPLNRLGHGKDIGETAAFLCSSKNRYITGQNIVVDGGILAGGWQDE